MVLNMERFTYDINIARYKQLSNPLLSAIDRANLFAVLAEEYQTFSKKSKELSLLNFKSSSAAAALKQ